MKKILGIVLTVLLIAGNCYGITWTKDWTSADDGSTFGGSDIQNIQNDVDGQAYTKGDPLPITSLYTDANILSITGSSLTTGGLGYFYSNSASTATRNLVALTNDNTAAVNTTVLSVGNDAQGVYPNASNGVHIHGITTHGKGIYCVLDSLTTGYNLELSADSLTAGTMIYCHSNSADTTARNLVNIVNDNTLASGATCLNIQQDSVGDGLCITSGATTSNAIIIDSGVTTGGGIRLIADSLTTGHALYITSNSASAASRSLVSIVNDHVSADDVVCLQLQQDGDDVQILGTGNENLSAAGVWTDRTSTYADKVDITPLAITGFIDKLKNLKLFEYRKKCEVYGNKQDVLSATEVIPAVDEYTEKKVGDKTEQVLKDKESRKNIDGVEYVLDGTDYKKVTGKEYKSVVKHADAPKHKGYILDDPSTPEELISRNVKGEIDGMSGTQNCNFLLAVNKELVDRLERLEARVEKLENPK